MDLQMYIQLAIRTRKDLLMNRLNDWHMVFGMMDEIGEIAKVFKAQMVYGREPDWINVQEELGDLLWFIVNLCDLHSFDLETVMGQNIAKLAMRYPQKYTDFDATNRDLEKERNVMEGYSQLKFVEEKDE